MIYEATILIHTPNPLTEDELGAFGDAMDDARAVVAVALEYGDITVEAHGPTNRGLSEALSA